MTGRRPTFGHAVLGGYLILFFLYLESPLLIIFITSFHEGLTVTFPPTSLSIRWYVHLWNHARDVAGLKPGLVTSFWTSVWLGAAVTAGTVVAGVLAAFGLQRHRFPGRDVLRQCFHLPILFPQIVTGVALVLWFSAVGGVPTWARLLLGHMILTLPYVIVITTASLETLDRRLEEAALNLGADGWRTFWHITLPGIRSSIVSGALFAWLVSFSNFTVTFFLYSGELKPLPIWIFEVISYVVDPSIAALSTILVLFTLLVLLVVSRLVALGRVVGMRR